MKLLLIEDSPSLSRALSTGLRNAGYAVDAVADGAEGLWLAQGGGHDVIVLDLMLPTMDGLSVLRRLRAEGHTTQVLVLTAKDAVEDRVKGLRAGADDYLVKPFAFDELLARIEALIRRGHGVKDPVIRIGDLVLDTVAKTVTRGERRIALTPREYALLEYLAHRRGEVISRSDVEAHIYDQAKDLMSNVVDSAICALRKKIDGPGAPRLIHTRRGMGYVLEEATA
jgi:DNA-binding response OmpR family regulator